MSIATFKTNPVSLETLLKQCAEAKSNYRTLNVAVSGWRTA